MKDRATRVSLKVDVDTHEGLRDGVPRLLDAFREAGVHATFFLSYGPDNAGRALLNVLRQRGFLKKMLRTGAPSLYGWRTLVSGTLLPARPIATAFPDLVRRIVDEGHEVGVHAWDHRLWQDHLDELSRAQVEAQFARSFEAHERLTGQRPHAVAAPAWYASPVSLAVQDALGLEYASDLRGGTPGFPVLDGYRSSTLQVPTTQPCLEELLARRAVNARTELPRAVGLVLDPRPDFETRVLPLHAEVEGGVHEPFLRLLLEEVRRRRWQVRLLRDVAREHRAAAGGLPLLQTALVPLEGRAGRVFAPRRGP